MNTQAAKASSSPFDLLDFRNAFPHSADMKWVRQPSVLLIILLWSLFSVHLILDVRERDGFSWMDPSQYYEAAQRLAAGISNYSDFVVASSYPLILAQFLHLDDSIPFALATHIFWLLILAGSIWLLCRQLASTNLAPLAFLLVMAAPALFGLSRELYIEFPLTALVTAHYALWFSRASWGQTRGYWLLFGLLMGIGFSIKMTYPVFLAGPIAIQCLRWCGGPNPRTELVHLLLSVMLPPLGVMLILYLLAPTAFSYYMSLGNTAMPPMRLIGPTAPLTGFYLDQIARNYLAWLTLPFIALATWAWRSTRKTTQSTSVLDLFLWIGLPLVLFTLMPVREPRHIAPILPAFALWIMMGIHAIENVRLRRLCMGLLASLATVQIVALSTNQRFAPYLMSRPIQAIPLQVALFETTPDASTFIQNGQLERNRWLYTRSILISGFPPNEALAIAWALMPGVVVHLDDWEDPATIWRDDAYTEFYDLALLTAFNLYNRRSGWRGRFHIFAREEALASADGVLFLRDSHLPPANLPGFRLHTSIDWGDHQSVDVLSPHTPPQSSYRHRYALNYLEQTPHAEPQERNAVLRAMQLDAVLRGLPLANADLAAESETKNIYYLSVYRPLQEYLTGFLTTHSP